MGQGVRLGFGHTLLPSRRGAGRGAVRPHVVRVGPRHEMGHRADSPRESSLTPSTAAQPHAGWCTGADGLPERSARGGACATPAPPPGEHSVWGSPLVFGRWNRRGRREGAQSTHCAQGGGCARPGTWDKDKVEEGLVGTPLCPQAVSAHGLPLPVPCGRRHQ